MGDRKPSPYKTNWNKFEEAVNDVVRKEVCRVFLWLYKGGCKPVWQYLDEVQEGKKVFNKDEKDRLKEGIPPTNMDITLLYRLLQRTCGLAKASDPVWLDDNSASLEHTLYLIKQERNELSHEGHKREAREMSETDLGQKLRYLHRLCANLLLEAARRCGRSPEVVKLSDKVDARLQEIQGVTADRFVLMAREERLRVPRTKMADDWYQQPVLRLQNRLVSLADLLQWPAADGASPSFLLVSGEAGVGKSSLCRYLEECWLRPRSDGNDLLQHYRLILRLRCQDICICDAVRLLKDELFPEAALQCSSDTLSEILRTVPTLWVLDGLDEVTHEASKLLASFIRNRRPKSTVLMTSRPELGRDFLQRHSNDGTLIAVNLLGTNPLETIYRITLSNNCDENSLRHAKSLMEQFEKLDGHIQQELMNPLKLHLALQDWKTTRNSTLRREFELSTLYHKITEAQIEALAERLSKQSAMAKSEATRKVKKWFRFLCESAFGLVQSRRVFRGVVREELLKKLEDKCDELRILSSQCMSTFLAHPDSTFSMGNSTYTFYHDSQVHFLAARHIASVMKGSQDLFSDTLTLFNIAALQECASEEPPLLYFLQVLILLISLIDASTPDDNIRMAIQLLLNAIPIELTPWMWLEVAKKASYQPKVMREIAKVMPTLWIISESRFEVARKFLNFRLPEKAIVQVINKPEEVKELEPLIHALTRLPIHISLRLPNHMKDLSGNNTADAFLNAVCCKESRCVLEGLEAHVGKEGYSLLRHPKITEYCRVMYVKVKSIKSLESLCECLQHFQSLNVLALLIATTELPCNSAKLRITSAKLSNVRKAIHLPYLTKETAANTAEFVAQLSKSYFKLIVYDTPLSVIEIFLQCLEMRCVTVDKFIGFIEVTEFGEISHVISSLPRKCPPEEFRQRWSLYRSLVRLIQPKGDP